MTSFLGTPPSRPTKTILQISSPKEASISSSSSLLLLSLRLILLMHHHNRQKVVFHNSVSVRETLHIQNYTEREIRNTWYSDEDISRIKLEIKCTVSSYRRGRLESLEHSNRYCLRGIEGNCNKAAAKARQLNKLIGLKSVLDEQERQENLGIQDPKLISIRYQNDISQRCQRAAQIVGRQDAMISKRLNGMDDRIYNDSDREKIGCTRIQLYLQQRKFRKLNNGCNNSESVVGLED
jgi:hypothetical protein